MDNHTVPLSLPNKDPGCEVTQTLVSKNQKRKEKLSQMHNSFLSRLVTNLSSYQISETELQVLQRGLKFVPTTHAREINPNEVVNNFVQRMGTQFYFRNSTTAKPRLWKPSTWIPPYPKNENLVKYFQLITHDLVPTLRTARPFSTPNLSRKESEALEHLATNNNITIKPADKGGSTVIMDKEDYVAKIHQLLDDTTYYQKLTYDPTRDIGKQVDSYIDHLLSRGHVSKQLANFLRPTHPPRTPVFYGLPKIHKPDIPLRPIVSVNDSPTENLSAFIDYLCQPFMQSLPSYIKDSKSFLQQLFHLGPLPGNAFLVTADVKSLYTNIPHQEGIDTLLKHMEGNPLLLPLDCPPLHVVRQLLQFILEENCFKFTDKYYRQIH